MMNVNDIPRELYSKIQLRFESDKDVRLLRTAQQQAQRTGDFRKALKIAQDIDNLWTICLDDYLQQAEKEVGTIDTESSDIPRKDKDEMMEKIMVLFMCCDIIESSTIDLNDILHRSHPDVDITTFNDLKQALTMAREKLKYLQETGDYMKDLVWAEKCDNMYDLMQSKAKSIIRKRKESKNWGDNMKKFDKKSDNDKNKES